MMPNVIMQAAEPWLGLDWKVIGIFVGILLAVIGGMLSLLYKLIVSTFSAHVKLFEEKLKSTAQKFQAAVHNNSAVDSLHMKQIQADYKRMQEKHDDLEKDFRKHLADLPREFVQRIDWIREFNKVDAKLDAIWKKVSETREDVAKKGTAK